MAGWRTEGAEVTKLHCLLCSSTCRHNISCRHNFYMKVSPDGQPSDILGIMATAASTGIYWNLYTEVKQAMCMQWQSQSQAVFCSTAHHQQSVRLLQPSHQLQHQRREKQKKGQLKAFLVAKAEVVTTNASPNVCCKSQARTYLQCACGTSSTSYCMFSIGLTVTAVSWFRKLYIHSVWRQFEINESTKQTSIVYMESNI